jgi:predicted transporter
VLTLALYFVLGAIALCVVVYAANVVMARMAVPPDIRNLVLLAIGLLGLIVIVIALFGSAPPWPGRAP